MRQAIARFVTAVLKSMGLRSLDKQYFVSYALIFLFALITAASLFLSLGSDATSINVAGRQRMLSQRVAKEALLVAEGVRPRQTVQQTIQLFERSHRALVDGDKGMGVAAVSDPAILGQLDEVWELWTDYKASIQKYLDAPSRERVEAIDRQSPVVLQAMHQGVRANAFKSQQPE